LNLYAVEVGHFLWRRARSFEFSQAVMWDDPYNPFFRFEGLLQGWLTFFVPGVPGPEGCCYAEEVSAGVQA